MTDMDRWSLALWGIAALLAVMILARLMKARYDALITRLRREWQEELDRKAVEERRRRQEERKRRQREHVQRQLEQASDEAA